LISRKDKLLSRKKKLRSRKKNMISRKENSLSLSLSLSPPSLRRARLALLFGVGCPCLWPGGWGLLFLPLLLLFSLLGVRFWEIGSRSSCA